uniref:Phospholipid/glycerol acyltransferase domain-containing protein n=1 Tax=Acrobeloides nanus TaxID=290746 RepID=A0A914EHV1_9BILA
MLLINAIFLVDKLRPVVPTVLLTGAWVPFASVSLGLGPISWVIPRKSWLWLNNRLYESYMRLCLFVFENVAAPRIHFYGDVEELQNRKESAIVLSNHQTNVPSLVDWVIIFMLSARHSSSGFEYGLRFLMKYVIHYAPLYGWYTVQHGFVYVRRTGFISDPLHKQFQYLRSLPEPFWFHIFPEGTRFNRRKPKPIEESIQFCAQKNLPQFKNVLVPRTGGFIMALNELRNELACIYDVTIGYSQTRLPNRNGIAPNMFEFFSSPTEEKDLHLHIRRYEIKDIPTSTENVKQWLYERFIEKDRLMQTFYEEGRFPDLVIQNAPHPPLSRHLLPFLVYVGALVLPIFSSNIRSVYLGTIAMSPILLAWLHIRGCV